MTATNGNPPRKTWLEQLLSGSAIATILVALIGQAMLSVVYQIINNEQQAASIHEIVTAQRNFEHAVKDKFEDLVRRYDENNRRLEQIDTVGTRALSLVNANQQRVMTQLDRFSERMIMLDKKIGDTDLSSIVKVQGLVDLIAANVKRLDEQQTRMSSIIEEMRSRSRPK